MLRCYEQNEVLDNLISSKQNIIMCLYANLKVSKPIQFTLTRLYTYTLYTRLIKRCRAHFLSLSVHTYDLKTQTNTRTHELF